MSKEQSESLVIATYTREQALEDGVLVEIFTDVWFFLTGGRPILATAAISADYSLGTLAAIWDQFVDWRRDVMPTLPEEDQLFKTEINEKTIWVLEDGQAFTILYPSDY